MTDFTRPLTNQLCTDISRTFLAIGVRMSIGILLISMIVACTEDSASTEDDNTDATAGSSDVNSMMDNNPMMDNDPMNQMDQSMSTEPDMMIENDMMPTPMLPSFEGELVACEINESFQALEPILMGGRTHPTGRGEQGAAYDPCNQRIILFGGNDFQPEECADFGPKRFKGDTWMYSLEYDNWARLNVEEAPHERGRHSMVLDRSRKKIYLYGGRYRPENMSGSYRLFSDFWAFDINTDTWSKLETTGDEPGRRFNTVMVYDHINDQVIVFGGNTSNDALSLAPSNDMYILDLNTLVWREVDTDIKPPRSIYHSMTMHSSENQLLVFGGGDENAFLGPFYNTLWAFDLNTNTWDEIWTPTMSAGPDARINAAFVDDVENQRVILFAGHDDTQVGHRNDVWSFHMQQGWTLLQEGDSGRGEGCDSFCSCPPDFVEVDMSSPERRQYQSFIPVLGENRAILFGGKGDCGYLDDTWSFSFTDDQWTEVEPAGQGEACKRTGQEGCTDLCY